MIPRCANPHAIFEKTRIISRKMLDMEEEEYRHLPPDLSLLEEFNAVMKRTVPLFDVEERAKKRRKVTVNVEDINKKDIMDEPILFRLISNGPPIFVSLKPMPQSFMSVKEPEIEDNEAQVKERRERASAIAVDADWVIRESLKKSRHPSTQSPVLYINLTSPLTTSAIMVFAHNKPVRKMRPSVDEKLGYPYDPSAKPDQLQTLVQGHPVIDLNRTLDDTSREKRKRRRNRKVKKIEHEFWRPDPQVKGKCMGYAMGYTGRRCQ